MARYVAGGLGELADLDEALGDGAGGGAVAAGGPGGGDGARVDGYGWVGLEEFEKELGFVSGGIRQ